MNTMKQDLINRLKLEQDELLLKLHIVIGTQEQQEIDRLKAELSTIHETLVTLGYYPAPVVDKVAVEV